MKYAHHLAQSRLTPDVEPRQKMRERVLVTAVALSMIFGATGCGNSKEAETATSVEETASTSPSPTTSDSESETTSEPTESESESSEPTESGSESPEPIDRHYEPLRDWKIDESLLLDQWDSLSFDEKKAAADDFFVAHNPDLTPIANLGELSTETIVTRWMDQAAIVSDLMLDENVENGDKMATNILETMTKAGGNFDSLEPLLKNFKSKREFFKDDVCFKDEKSFDYCNRQRKYFRLAKILEISPFPFRAQDINERSFSAISAVVQLEDSTKGSAIVPDGECWLRNLIFILVLDYDLENQEYRALVSMFTSSELEDDFEIPLAYGEDPILLGDIREAATCD